MKNPFIRIALLGAALGILIFSFACGPTANDNSRVQNVGQDQANGNMAIVERDAACNAANIETRRGDTEAKLNDLIEDDNELENHVKAEVEIAGDADSQYLEVYLTGSALGEDELEDLSKIVRKFMHKDQNCVKKAIFIVAPDANTNESKRARGFEWTSCEYPTQLCSNGTCSNSCPNKANMNTANTNSVGNNSNTANQNN